MTSSTESRLIFSLVLCAAFGSTAYAADDNVTVNATSVTRSLTNKPTGVNMNFLNDADVRRIPGSRTLQAGLQDLKATHLRYPGGEKSDTYYFAAPTSWPATSASAPKFCRYGPSQWPSSDVRFGNGGNTPINPLSFDAFMAVSNSIGGKPVIVVPYDCAYGAVPAGGSTPSLQQLKDHAVEWVRYANITKNWNVQYWEIGNETDISPASYGGNDPGVIQYATDVIAFSQAMKAVDPTIKIGVNALSQSRINALLARPGLGAAIDYISVHTYPTYNWTSGYDTFRTTSPNLAGMVQQATSSINSATTLTVADKARIKVSLTEFNAIDWGTGGWENVNDLGHGLVVFDMIGQNLSEPKLDFLQFWNTRWVDNDAASVPLGTTNLIANPGFELTPNYNGWTLDWGNSNITTMGADIHSGTKAAQITGTGGRAQVITSAISTNSVYTLKFWAKRSTNSGYTGVGVTLYSAGSGSTKVLESSASVTSTSWQEYTITFNTPASGFSYAELWFYTNVTAQLDDVSMVTGAKPTINDALDRTNNLTPAGRALAIWGQFTGDNLVSSTGATTNIRSYAIHTPATNVTTVFLLNKQTVARTAQVTLQNATAPSTAQRWEMSGTSSADFSPTWSQKTDVAVASNVANLTLPALSITVLKLDGPDSSTTYTISGNVTFSGSGLVGVTMSDGTRNATTDSSGNYIITGAPNGIYTVTPSKAGYSFLPTTLSVTLAGANQTGKNFTATALPTYSISGTVSVSGSGLSGVLVSNGNGKTATTDASGLFTLTGMPQGSYTITPSKNGYTFTPITLSGTISANLTGQNFTATLSLPTYEGFNYSAGSGALAGKSGGNNWNGSWDAAANDINATGLTYTSSGTLTTAGGKAVVKVGTSSFRSISSTTKANGTYWLSFIAKSSTPGSGYGGLSLYDGTNERLFVGQRFNASNWGIERSGSTNITSATGTGINTFLVVKIVLQTGNDFAYFWTNPSLSVTPTDASATLFSNITDFTFDRIRLEQGGLTSLEVDEIRIGESYSDVAPTSTAVIAPIIQNKPLANASGTVGQAMSYNITASGNPTPTFSISSGTLPAGLSINSSTGSVTGTPTATSNATVTVTATNTQGSDNTNLSFAIALAPPPTIDPILTGTITGSPPYGGFAIYDANSAFDGNTATFFAPAISNSFVQIDMGSSVSGRVTLIRYYPRSGYPERMNGAIFQGSNDGTSWTNLHTISINPLVQWNEVNISNATYFRYLRYTQPVLIGDVSEIEFRGLTQSSNTGLQTFHTSYNLAENGSQDMLTPANDGVKNLQKYAFNMIGTGTGQASTLSTPNRQTLTANGSAGLPLMKKDGSGRLTITFIRRKSAMNPGITYQVEYSNDLSSGTWAINSSANEEVTPIDVDFERITSIDSVVQKNRFARVTVSTP